MVQKSRIPPDTNQVFTEVHSPGCLQQKIQPPSVKEKFQSPVEDFSDLVYILPVVDCRFPPLGG